MLLLRMVGAQRRIGFSLGVGLEGRWENVGVPIHWDSHRANCVNSRWLPPVSHVVNRRAEKSPCDPHSYYNKQRATPSDGRAAFPAHSIQFLRRLPSSSLDLPLPLPSLSLFRALSSTTPLRQEDTPHVKTGLQHHIVLLDRVILKYCSMSPKCNTCNSHGLRLHPEAQNRDGYRTPEMLKGRDIRPRVLNIESSACEHGERIQRASDDVRFPRCGNCKLLEKIDTRH